MSSRDTHLTQTGPQVQQLLDKIEDIGLASVNEDGLMSKHDKATFDDMAQDRPMTNIEIQAILDT